VIEVNQPDKATRRKRGKTDAIDAEAAAHAVLSERATPTAKTSSGAGRGDAGGPTQPPGVLAMNLVTQPWSRLTYSTCDDRVGPELSSRRPAQ